MTFIVHVLYSCNLNYTCLSHIFDLVLPHIFFIKNKKIWSGFLIKNIFEIRKIKNMLVWSLKERFNIVTKLWATMMTSGFFNCRVKIKMKKWIPSIVKKCLQRAFKTILYLHLVIATRLLNKMLSFISTFTWKRTWYDMWNSESGSLFRNVYCLINWNLILEIHIYLVKQ